MVQTIANGGVRALPSKLIRAFSHKAQSRRKEKTRGLGKGDIFRWNLKTDTLSVRQRDAGRLPQTTGECSCSHSKPLANRRIASKIKIFSQQCHRGSGSFSTVCFSITFWFQDALVLYSTAEGKSQYCLRITTEDQESQCMGFDPAFAANLLCDLFSCLSFFICKYTPMAGGGGGYEC